MTKQKLHIGRFELLRVLDDGQPDVSVHVFDPDWGSGYINGYRWETLAERTLATSDVGTDIAGLVKRGWMKFVTVRPKLFARMLGASAIDYGYLTPLGAEAIRNPELQLEPLQRDDYDRRYEPKGMWLRQIEGLPPLSD